MGEVGRLESNAGKSSKVRSNSVIALSGDDEMDLNCFQHRLPTDRFRGSEAEPFTGQPGKESEEKLSEEERWKKEKRNGKMLLLLLLDRCDSAPGGEEAKEEKLRASSAIFYRAGSLSKKP